MEQVQINQMVRKVIGSLKGRSEKADLVFPRQIASLVGESNQEVWDEVLEEADIVDTSQAISNLHESITQSGDFASISVYAQQAEYLKQLSRMDYVEHQLYWNTLSATDDDEVLPLNSANMVDQLNGYLAQNEVASGNND